MRFYTEGLLSKWGFEDGDILDNLLYDTFQSFKEDAHEVLIEVVRKYLLPNIDQHVTVREIVTIHNPIRATFVDGVTIDDYNGTPGVTLTPEYVDVDDQEIISLAKKIWGKE